MRAAPFPIPAYYELTTRVYRKFATWYDWVVVPLRAFRRRVATDSRAGPGQEVLDVACGTGEQSFALAETGAAVTGIDLSPDMLGVAETKNDAHVSFRQADATALPFEDQSFDLASISFALHEMPTSIGDAVLREMARVVRARGRIVVVDYGLPRSRLGRWLMFHLVALYERQMYREFMATDLPARIEAAGFDVFAARPDLLGAARVLVGMRRT